MGRLTTQRCLQLYVVLVVAVVISAKVKYKYACKQAST